MKASIKIFLIFSLLVLCMHSYAQNNEWKLYKKVSGVEIYTTEVSCSEPSIPSQKAIILKVINTTNRDIEISWDRRVWYDGKEVDHNIKEGENHMVTTVKANSFVKGDCSVPFGALYFYLEFIVYKNSGKIIFESYNSEVGWNGNYNGSLVQDGVYIWQIEFGEYASDKNHKYRGHVTVLK